MTRAVTGQEPGPAIAAAAGRLGLNELRPAQLHAVAALAEDRDVLVVMPTGAGKSAIYQTAGIVLAASDPRRTADGKPLAGLTVVVSPLLALQHDQQVALAEHLGGDAVITLNSGLTRSGRTDAIAAIADGRAQFVFLAPEQLANDDVVAVLAERSVSLFAVDEAHCVVSWGHDFRPDYATLGAVIGRLGRPVIAALTATASPPVRAEISRLLDMDSPDVIVAGFDRPNLSLAVRHLVEASDQEGALLDAVVEHVRPGIIYAGTRAQTEELAAKLVDRGLQASAYHAGLRKAERNRVHDGFLDGEIDIVVATSAFGMGIDKPDVRFVFHASVSESIDSYYQEIGRAGRDGESADAVLFYRQQDLGLRAFFAGKSANPDDLLRVLAVLSSKRRKPIKLAKLAEQTGLKRRPLTGIVTRLRDAGVTATSDDAITPVPGLDLERALEMVAAVDDRRHAFDTTRLEMMRNYAEAGADCRRLLILSYFGEPFEPPCGNCDNCDPGTRDQSPHTSKEATDFRSQFEVSQRVRHPHFGVGTVMRNDPDGLTVLFDDEGYRTLSPSLIEERGLLEAESA